MDEILLDTTYLLPILGLGVDLRNFANNFGRLLAQYSVLYNPVSLVEAKWITLRLTRRELTKREALLAAYRQGLTVLATDGRLRRTDFTGDKVEEIADRLLSEDGVEDYFDRVLYGTATVRGCVLLTEDEELLKLGRKKSGRKPSETIAWNEMTRRLKE